MIFAYDKIKTIPPRKIDLLTLEFIKKFAKSVMNNTHLSVRGKIFGIDIFWGLIQDKSGLAKELYPKVISLMKHFFGLQYMS